MIDVAHYGLHRAKGGIAFLLQGTDGINALGLGLDCPFKVASGQWTRCNHNFSLPDRQPSNWEEFSSFLDDPLFEAMLPAPRDDRTPLLVSMEKDDRHMLMRLAEMSSFVEYPIYTMWLLNVNRMRNHIQATNVQPLVITNVVPSDRKALEPLLTVAHMAPRQLILFGDKHVVLGHHIRPIQTRLRSQTFPPNMKELGAWYLKQRMLKP